MVRDRASDGHQRSSGSEEPEMAINAVRGCRSATFRSLTHHGDCAYHDVEISSTRNDSERDDEH